MATVKTTAWVFDGALLKNGVGGSNNNLRDAQNGSSLDITDAEYQNIWLEDTNNTNKIGDSDTDDSTGNGAGPEGIRFDDGTGNPATPVTTINELAIYSNSLMTIGEHKFSANLRVYELEDGRVIVIATNSEKLPDDFEGQVSDITLGAFDGTDYTHTILSGYNRDPVETTAPSWVWDITDQFTGGAVGNEDTEGFSGTTYTGLNGLYNDNVTLYSNPSNDDGSPLIRDTDTGDDNVEAIAGDGMTVDGQYQQLNEITVYNGTIHWLDASATMQTFDTIVVLVQTVDANGNGHEFLRLIDSDKSKDSWPEGMHQSNITSISLGAILDVEDGGVHLASIDEFMDPICFAGETQIETQEGPVKARDIEAGMMVKTADHGYQPVRYVFSRTVPATGKLAPVVFEKGAIGNTDRLVVSPRHRILRKSWNFKIIFGHDEVLVTAENLINGDTIHRGYGKDTVTYCHILFDQHELIEAHGVMSESFHPGGYIKDDIEASIADELENIFPEIKSIFTNYGQTARRVLASNEVDLFNHIYN